MAGIGAQEFTPKRKGDTECKREGCNGHIHFLASVNPEHHIDLYECDKCRTRYFVRG